MKFLVREKYFYKTLFAIALPIALQNLIAIGVSLLDTLMLGALGDVALSASSLANQPFFIFSVLIFGIASGSAVLTAQYWGKKDVDTIQLIFGMALKVAIVFSFLFFLISYLFPEQIMRIFTDEEEVIAAGVEYLSITCFANLIFGVSSILCSLFRSVEVVGIALASSITTLIVNGCLNYVLIFGKFGFPALGIQGAAIATLTARCMEFVIILLYVTVFEKKVKLSIRKMLPNKKVLWQDFVKFSSPVVINEFMWSFATSMQAIVIGRLGKAVVAANSVASVVQQLATVFIWGVASASAVLIGKTIGEGDERRAKSYSDTLQVICVIIGIFATTVILLLRLPVIGFYNISDEAKMYADQLLTVLSFIVFFISYTAPTMVGILRGGGDIKFVMWLDIIFLWLVTTPLGFLTAFVFRFPPWLVFAIMRMDEPIKSVIAFIRLRGSKWIRNVTRDRVTE